MFEPLPWPQRIFWSVFGWPLGWFGLYPPGVTVDATEDSYTDESLGDHGIGCPDFISRESE